MTHAASTLTLTCFLALLPASPSFTQTHEATPETTAAPVAYVYVQTEKGVDVYDATAAGSLTLVKGSPFADSGQMEGNNGGYLISVGTDDLHSYKIGTSGAVGKQASEINTQSYSGAECGNTDGSGAVLDHTGKYFFVQLTGAPGNGGVYNACASWQTYQVESDGAFSFLNSIEYYGSYTAFSTFGISSKGDLSVNGTFKETDPVAPPSTQGPTQYFPVAASADPNEHLAVVLQEETFNCCGIFGPYQLASYTINKTTGAVVSTNTATDMPTPEEQDVDGSISNLSLRMSPSGELVALAGWPGLQVFHFNGASPITTYSSLLLPTVDIDQLAWDNSNHLYALSYESGELYVYTVTPTSISEVAGSPYKVQGAYGVKGLIVVPK
jgi:hypothetical protein